MHESGVGVFALPAGCRWAPANVVETLAAACYSSRPAPLEAPSDDRATHMTGRALGLVGLALLGPLGMALPLLLLELFYSVALRFAGSSNALPLLAAMGNVPAVDPRQIGAGLLLLGAVLQLPAGWPGRPWRA